MPRVYTGRAISERCQVASYLRGRSRRAATVDVRLALHSTCEAPGLVKSSAFSSSLQWFCRVSVLRINQTPLIRRIYFA